MNTLSIPDRPALRALQSLVLTLLQLVPQCFVITGDAGEVDRRVEGTELPAEIGQEGLGEAIEIGIEL